MSIEHKIEIVIEALAAPLTATESAEGWSVETKKVASVFFNDLRRKLNAGDALPPMSIPRWLDHLGISNGTIFELSAQISDELSNQR